MLLELLGVVVALILVLFITLVLYARWNYGALEAMGVPVEKPHWLLGNVSNQNEEYCHWEDLRRFTKLGPIYGIYHGRSPIVHVADPKIIHQMLYVDSEHFAKTEVDFGDPMFNDMIELLNGEKWKIVRNLLTPQFTTAKLKMQSQVVQKISNSYIDHLKIQADKNGRICKVDLHEMAAPFTIEVIAEMLCGIKLQDAKSPDNKFVQDMKRILYTDFQRDPNIKYFHTFPFLYMFLPHVPPDALQTLKNYLKDVLEMREKSGNPDPDMVSVLLEMHKKIQTDPDYKRLGITEDTVYAQAFEFFAASFLGIVVTTKMLFYNLVNNPEVHEKVLEELDAVLNKHGGELGYDAVTELEYLGACIQETLRISPAFFRPDRSCVKEWTYGNIRIPKGTQIQFPIYAVHHNEEIYSEPKAFKPERFLGENKNNLPKCSFLTFGEGPRQCLGIRLAFQLLKIFIGGLLKEFKIEKRSDTVWKEAMGNDFLVYLDPIYVDFVRK